MDWLYRRGDFSLERPESLQHACSVSGLGDVYDGGALSSRCRSEIKHALSVVEL